jgi:hypothetical protein
MSDCEVVACQNKAAKSVESTHGKLSPRIKMCKSCAHERVAEFDALTVVDVA